MNLVAHPPTEIIVVQSSRPISLGIDILHNFDQVCVLNRDVSAIN